MHNSLQKCQILFFGDSSSGPGWHNITNRIIQPVFRKIRLSCSFGFFKGRPVFAWKFSWLPKTLCHTKCIELSPARSSLRGGTVPPFAPYLRNVLLLTSIRWGSKEKVSTFGGRRWVEYRRFSFSRKFPEVRSSKLFLIIVIEQPRGHHSGAAEPSSFRYLNVNEFL
jgi:hypothetical protein